MSGVTDLADACVPGAVSGPVGLPGGDIRPSWALFMLNGLGAPAGVGANWIVAMSVPSYFVEYPEHGDVRRAV